jgi:hypothetical protein
MGGTAGRRDCLPVMALLAQTALDSTVRQGLGDSPLMALAALEHRGPLSQAEWPVG